MRVVYASHRQMWIKRVGYLIESFFILDIIYLESATDKCHQISSLKPWVYSIIAKCDLTYSLANFPKALI